MSENTHLARLKQKELSLESFNRGSEAYRYKLPRLDFPRECPSRDGLLKLLSAPKLEEVDTGLPINSDNVDKINFNDILLGFFTLMDRLILLNSDDFTKVFKRAIVSEFPDQEVYKQLRQPTSHIIAFVRDLLKVKGEEAKQYAKFIFEEINAKGSEAAQYFTNMAQLSDWGKTFLLNELGLTP